MPEDEDQDDEREVSLTITIDLLVPEGVSDADVEADVHNITSMILGHTQTIIDWD